MPSVVREDILVGFELKRIPAQEINVPASPQMLTDILREEYIVRYTGTPSVKKSISDRFYLHFIYLFIYFLCV